MNQIDLRILRLTPGGRCIAEEVSDDLLSQKKVFIPDVIPGETIRANVTQEKKHFRIAEVDKILTPSEHRIDPACTYTNCGGCDLLHMTLAAQRDCKLEMVKSTLLIKLNLPQSYPVQLIGKELSGDSYRKRISLHITRGGKIGFYQKLSHSVVDIKQCMISSPELNRTLQLLRAHRSVLGQIAKKLVLEENPPYVDVTLHLRKKVKIPEAIDILPHVASSLSDLKVRWRVFRGRQNCSEQFVALQTSPEGSGGFSQVNPAANEILIPHVISQIRSKEVTELYAGAGNFSFPLVRKGHSVVAVELDPILVQRGATAAQNEALDDRLVFINQSCEKFVESQRCKSAILLDPPREGARDVVSRLTPNHTSEIIYVSCDLPTLVRDLRILQERGFSPVRTAVLDMFPQTHHVETITYLCSEDFDGENSE